MKRSEAIKIISQCLLFDTDILTTKEVNSLSDTILTQLEQEGMAPPMKVLTNLSKDEKDKCRYPHILDKNNTWRSMDREWEPEDE